MKLIEKQNHDTLFYILALIIFFAFLIFTISGQEGMLRLLSLKKTRDELISKNKQLLTENLSLRQQQTNLYNLKTIEHTARESLGLVYPGEIVFVSRPFPH